MLLHEQTVADQRHRRAARELSGKLDGERVHGDGADHPAPFAVDQHLGAREVSPKAVRVAHGHEPDPGRLLRDEAPPVPGALTGVQQLHLRELAAPGEHRLEAVLGRIRPERREPVERNAAARGREA